MNQLNFVAINLLKAWKKSRVQSEIGFDFASHCLKKLVQDF